MGYFYVFAFIPELLVWLNIVYKKTHCHRENNFQGGLTSKKKDLNKEYTTD